MQYASIVPVFNSATPEEEVAEFVQDIKSSGTWNKQLLSLLREQHPMYTGRGANEVMRLRGFIIESMGHTGFPEEALLYLYEELESSRDAYMVAAAARALRAAKNKRTDMANYLMTAVNNIRYGDNSVSFESYTPAWPLEHYTTGLRETFQTLGWLGAYAKAHLATLIELRANTDSSISSETMEYLKAAVSSIGHDKTVVPSCCSNPPAAAVKTATIAANQNKSIGDLPFEDHNGRKLSFKDAFTSQPSLVAFFYTRCDNPIKCSLTITNMAQIQKVLREQGLEDKVNLVAITYDEAYDLPHRLKLYAEARRFELGDHAMMLRTTGDAETLRHYFDLGVNYTGNVVNKHIVEMYLLDATGQIRISYLRLKTDNATIVANLKALAEGHDIPSGGQDEDAAVAHAPAAPAVATGNQPAGEARVAKTVRKTATSSVLPVLLLFLPKCPLCFAAYFSFLGITSMQMMPYVKWLLPALVLAVGVNLFVMYRAAKRRNGYLPFYLCTAGSLVVIVSWYFLHFMPGSYFGISLIFMGAVINALPFTTFLKLKSRFSGLALAR